MVPANIHSGADLGAFKSLNRIVDDLRITAGTTFPILGVKPLDYAGAISKSPVYDLLTLNTHVAHTPAAETTVVKFNEEDGPEFTLTTLRGLLVRNQDLFHWKIVLLQENNHFSTSVVDKYDFHITDAGSIPTEERNLFSDLEHLIDDAFFIASNGPRTVCRVSVQQREFSIQDLDPVLDQKKVADRYLGAIEGTDLSPDTVPTPLLCLQTLFKILRGPLLLAPDQPRQTISISKTNLDAKVDIDILFTKLGFTRDEDELIPPSMDDNPAMKDSYINKSIELLYLILKEDTKYTFSDNGSLIFRTFNEVDKHIAMSLGRNHNSNSMPFFVSLSCCTYFQDELVIKCFENTIKSDRGNLPHYVDALKSIIHFKASLSSTKLKYYYNNLSAKGELIGYSDYLSALRTLDIDLPDIDDDFIISMYVVAYKNDTKNYSYFNKNLRIIAKVRNSATLNSYIDSELMPVNLAFEELSIEEITEDEVVITAFEFRLDELLQASNFTISQEVTFLYNALLSVAVSRKSYILMNYIESKYPQILNMTSVSVDDAYQSLNSSPKDSDFELISKFQDAVPQKDIRILRQCLRAIANARDSLIIQSFLTSGKIDASLLPAENWPAGLDNIGNTCYLNSLLQYYFCIKPLREAILNFDESKVPQNKERKIGGRKVEELEIKRSVQFVYHLQNLFSEMIHTPLRCVAPSKELAYLSFLPLSQPVNFKSSEEPSDDDVVIVSETQDEVPVIDLNSDMSPEEKIVNQPKLLEISTDQMESTIEVGRQQDVTECIENVTYQIETALEPEAIEEDGEQYDLIKKLFYGKTKQTITPEKADPRVSIERFFSLIINVSDHPKDIYDSLDNYFNEDLVHLEEGTVKKSITIKELPDVVQFHVQRVLFDREKLMAYKSLEHIPFSEQIYLDRYLDTDDEEMLQKKSEVFKWKSEMKELHAEKDEILQLDPETNLSIIDALLATKKYLESKVVSHGTLSVQANTIITIQEEIDLLKEKLHQIHSRLHVLQGRVSNQFIGYNKVGYLISAIFIHRGEASYGHYWVYIRDPKKNLYRKYNDEIVTEVPLSEVFNFAEGNTATPYYIVYTRDVLMDEYIEPLRREIRETL